MKKLGLVFSGGGGKGAYEIGVWKALKEYGVDANVKAVAGTSVGGLNGALFVADDYQAAENLWLDIAPSKVLTLKQEDIAKAIAKLALGAAFPGVMPKALLTLSTLLGGKGAFSQIGLAELIKESGVCNTITGASLPFHICALTAATGKLIYPTLNTLSESEKLQWLLATSAIPVVFPTVKINKENYADGGVLPSPYSDNTPCLPLIEQHQCTHIINIHLERTADLAPFKQQHPNVNFWHIVPTQAFDGLIDSLNFTKENAQKLIELGYQDTAKILEQFKAFQDDEIRYLDAVFEFGASHEQFTDQIQVNKILRGETDHELEHAKSTGLSDPAAKNIENNINLTPMPVEQVLAELGKQIQQQERELINSNIDTLLEEMTDNSDDLLDQAFTSITTLASTEGRINNQLEQGHVSRFVGAITGSNAKQQASINWDLNRAIYANQQLIQKLNHKQMLTMEAMVTLANKTNYLMSHVNVLYGSVKKLDQNFNQSLQLMKQGIESLAHSCYQQFCKIDNRLHNLERARLVDDWYHQSKYQSKAQEHLSNKADNSDLFMQITTNFYNGMGRAWTNNELIRYVNLLDELNLAHTPIELMSLLKPSSSAIFNNSIDCSYVLPVLPSKQRSYPLLTGLQIVADFQHNNTINASSSIDTENQTLTQHSHTLCESRSGLELGLELLHSLRCNDKRTPIDVSSTSDAKQLESTHHGIQAGYLSCLTHLNTLNETYLSNVNIQDDISYLNQQISNFKVVMPIVGKFSSGKSTLLNSYLGKNSEGEYYLKHDITPETAIATELCFAKQERIVCHYNDEASQEHPISELKHVQVTASLKYIQAFINVPSLKNRPNIVLVDMPGFDASNQAHQKAIASYLAKGDVFVSLFSANATFDASVMVYLQEISNTYNKQVINLVSKVGRITNTKLVEVKKELSKSLSTKLGKSPDNIVIGQVESTGKKLNINDFSKAVDTAACQFDRLLEQRYASSFLALIQRTNTALLILKSNAQSSEAQLKQQMEDEAESFRKLEKSIMFSIEKMQRNLTSEGKEQLLNQAQSVLNSAVNSLVTAAKNNQLSQKITEILRPTLQQGVNQIIEREISQLECQLGEISQQDFSQTQISINLPVESREQFSVKFAAVGAGVSALFLGPLGIAISGLIGGLLGKKDNAEQREKQIVEQVQNQVIPHAIAHVRDYLDIQFNEVLQQIRAVLLKNIEQEKQCHKLQLTQLQQTLQQNQDEFNQQQQVIEQGINECRHLQNCIDNNDFSYIYSSGKAQQRTKIQQLSNASIDNVEVESSNLQKELS